MKISTKSRYGLRALLELANREDGQILNLKEISERQNISNNYLEQIFIKLREHNIVKSVKGYKGGYYIERDIDRIYLDEIVKAIEDDISLIKKDKKEGNSYYIKMESVLEKCLFNKLEKKVVEELKNVSLGELLRGEIEYESKRI